VTVINGRNVAEKRRDRVQRNAVIVLVI
jgi:hypothetical protein